MAKQGQHQHDDNDPQVSRGHNNPDKSVTITTGSYKKAETTHEQHARHEDSEQPGQFDKNEWRTDTREPQGTSGTRGASSRANRDGSDSNASKGTQGH